MSALKVRQAGREWQVVDCTTGEVLGTYRSRNMARRRRRAARWAQCWEVTTTGTRLYGTGGTRPGDELGYAEAVATLPADFETLTDWFGERIWVHWFLCLRG